MKTTIKGDVEEISNVGIPGATRVVLESGVEDHLGKKLVGREPGARSGERLAKAVVGDMGTHVGVNVEVGAITEETQVEFLRQLIHKE